MERHRVGQQAGVRHLSAEIEDALPIPLLHRGEHASGEARGTRLDPVAVLIRQHGIYDTCSLVPPPLDGQGMHKRRISVLTRFGPLVLHFPQHVPGGLEVPPLGVPYHDERVQVRPSGVGHPPTRPPSQAPSQDSSREIELPLGQAKGDAPEECPRRQAGPAAAAAVRSMRGGPNVEVVGGVRSHRRIVLAVLFGARGIAVGTFPQSAAFLLCLLLLHHLAGGVQPLERLGRL
mmetsp:Transcript_34386/g.70230  ORF Transcript_34386/g.70230 Transcript_34386/m.70230 type:complete len:233 (-) Transcript_34386:207-905(-)